MPAGFHRTWPKNNATTEFEKFEVKRLQREAQEPTSDFDHFVEKTKKIKTKAMKVLPEDKRTKAKTKRKEIDHKE